MKTTISISGLSLTVIGLVFVLAGSQVYAGEISDNSNENRENLKVPFAHGLGKQKFVQMCSKCHGEWAGGTDQGPPLLHGFYKPSHHSDSAFYRAIFQGSRQHHWNFGDMLPVKGVKQSDAKQIIEFLRWLQKEKGLF